MISPLKLTAALSPPVVAYSGQERLVYILLELAGGEAVGNLPLDVALVIDCSDSMRIKLVTEEQFAYLAGISPANEILNDQVPAWRIEAVPSDVAESLPTRMGFVQQALRAAAEFLQDNDRFSLTAFAGDAIPLLPALPGSQRARLGQAAAELEGLQLGDGTRLSAGLAVGYHSLGTEAIHARPRRLLLLTDGHAQDAAECYEWAARTRADGIALTTFGIGSDFNEELLIPLADMTGGNAYFIENLEQLPAAFRGELTNARRDDYQNVKIELRLPNSVRLRRCFRVRPNLGTLDPGSEVGKAYSLFLGPVSALDPQTLLLEMMIPPWQPGAYRLAQTALSWNQSSLDQRETTFPLDVLLDVVEGVQEQPNPKVIDVVERVNAYSLGTQALAAARCGSQEAAQQLRQAAARLLAVGEQRLGQLMLAHANALEQTEQVDPNITKRLSYATRRLNLAADKR